MIPIKYIKEPSQKCGLTPVHFIKENRDTHQIKISTYILMIVVTIILLVALASKCKAENPYNVPPRILSYCEQGYIGYEYSEIKRAKCHKIWGMFNRENLLGGIVYGVAYDYNLQL